jgi:hypothetical protein
MAPALSQREPEARGAVRGRQETGWYRVFKCDDSIDVLARAVRSGAAHETAWRVKAALGNQKWHCGISRSFFVD